MSLTRFESQDGIEIFIDTQTGEAATSVSGYARMGNKAKSTISDRINRSDHQLKSSEILTSKGLRTVRIINEDLIVEWLPKDNPQAATALLKLGVRAALHQMAGYKVTSEAVVEQQKEPSIVEQIEEEKTLILALNSVGNLDAGLVAGILGNSIKRRIPHLTSSVEDYKSVLGASNIQELGLSLTVSEIVKIYEEKTGRVVKGNGKNEKSMYKTKAKYFNKYMEQLGFQEESGKKSPRWKAVGVGKNHSTYSNNTAKHSDQTVQQLRWFESIVNEIINIESEQEIVTPFILGLTNVVAFPVQS